jgi:hypothetical protein
VLKFENEVLRTRCKSLCAKGLDSRISYHSDVDAFKIASSQLELTSSLERESLDGGICAGALDSSLIATPKLLLLPTGCFGWQSCFSHIWNSCSQPEVPMHLMQEGWTYR